MINEPPTTNHQDSVAVAPPAPIHDQLAATASSAPTPLAVTPPTAAPERKRSTLPPPPRIEQWVDVPGFDQHKIKLWLTYPAYLREQMESGDEDVSRAALGQIVLEHNGWPDDEGYELPQPRDPEFWRLVDDYRAAAIFMILRAQPAKNVVGALQKRKS